MHYWIFVLYKVLELSYTEKQDNYIKKKKNISQNEAKQKEHSENAENW